MFKIADLPILFYCKNEEEASFIRGKYHSFLTKRSKILRPAGKIFFGQSSSLKIQVKGKNVYLPSVSLAKKFGCFDLFFEILLMPILAMNKGFILHASSLVKNGLGYIFVGEENTGKSTIRKLFPDLVCLGDDTAIVRKADSCFFLFSCPFYQRNYKPSSNLKVPIAGVSVLTAKADFNLVKPLSFPENFKAILSNAYISGLEKKDQEKESSSKICYEFCLENKIFALSFKKDRSFWPFLEEAVKQY